MSDRIFNHFQSFSEKFTHDVTFLDRTTGLTMVNFYFRDLSTLNITQIPKTDAFTFLNNIGGGLGLLIGIALPQLARVPSIFGRDRFDSFWLVNRAIFLIWNIWLVLK